MADLKSESDLAKEIPALVRVKRSSGLSVREAAKEAGVSSATLSRVENDGPMSLETYFKIREWLGLTIERSSPG